MVRILFVMASHSTEQGIPTAASAAMSQDDKRYPPFSFDCKALQCSCTDRLLSRPIGLLGRNYHIRPRLTHTQPWGLGTASIEKEPGQSLSDRCGYAHAGSLQEAGSSELSGAALSPRRSLHKEQPCLSPLTLYNRSLSDVETARCVPICSDSSSIVAGDFGDIKHWRICWGNRPNPCI